MNKVTYLRDTMIRLIYHSHQRSSLSPGQFDELCRKASGNNSASQITGLLLKNDSEFLQYLEGPVDEIRATFDRIARDPRHYDIKILEMGRIRKRRFKTWKMCGLDSTTGQCSELMYPAAAVERMRGSGWAGLGLGAVAVLYEYAQLCELLVDAQMDDIKKKRLDLHRGAA